jgi:flagellar motor switch protein FliM
VVSIGLEIRVGDTVGLMNIGMPSIIIKMLKHKFDQQWSVRKTDSTVAEQTRTLNLIKPTKLHLDARLESPTLLVQDLMTIEPGHVLNLDHPLNRPLRLTVNGQSKYLGNLVVTRNRRSFLIEKLDTGC